MMGDPVQSLSKTVHPEVAGPKLQQSPCARALGAGGDSHTGGTAHGNSAWRPGDPVGDERHQAVLGLCRVRFSRSDSP